MKFLSLFAVLVVLSSFQSRAAEPPNNNFTNRIILIGSSLTTTGYNAGANKETAAGEPNLSFNNGGKSVWWGWTAPADGRARITTIGSTLNNTILGVYTGTNLAALTLVGSDDNSGGNNKSLVTFNAVSNTQYQVMVDVFNNNTGNNITLNIHLTNTPPAILFTTPVDNSSFQQPVNITLAGYASDYRTTNALNGVGGVHLYQGSTRIGGVSPGNASTAFSFTWTNPPPGSYSLTAIASNLGGLMATSGPINLTVTSNAPPSVSITNPIDNSVFSTAPASITINASASDSGGAITNVEFYQGAIKLGQDTTSPYSFTWNNVAAGDYTLTAVAYDAGGLTTTSAPVHVTVTPNTSPTVSITGPANGQSFTAPAAITLNASASDPGGSVTNVSFYQNGVKLGQDTSSPYIFAWTNVPAGIYQLTAVAFDNGGLTTTSATVNVSVTNSFPPLVNIVSPLAGAVFSERLNLTILANASDPDGLVSKVEFFQGATKLGQVTSGPFAFIWSNVLAGSYSLSAVATDNSGVAATSGAVNVTISALAANGVNVVPAESIWKYRDDGSDQGTAWQAIIFNDSAWASGRAQLGYGDGDELTTVSFGADPNNKFITTYFRRSFVLTNASRFTNLVARILRDDGAVVYLNGTEVFRSNMPEGPVGNTTLAASTVNTGPDEGITFFPGNVPPALLVNGTNLIAVEVHQILTNSSDISFDLELTGELGPPINAPPTVTVTNPANNAVFFVPANVTIGASASDSDGLVTNVSFYANGAKLGQDTNAPFSLLWNNVAPGSYTILAVATDNSNASITSAPVNITVISNALPSVSLTNPANNSVFTGPLNITLGASAADSDGSITKVDFFRGSTKLGTALSSPYSLTWSNVPAGNYTLTAVATDNNGGTNTSAPVSITVNVAPGTSLWVAFNDHVAGTIGTQTASNATVYSVPGVGAPAGSSGALKDIAAGTNLPVTLTITSSGTPTGGNSTDVPAAGTPCFNTFNGYVYFGNGTAAAVQIKTGDFVTYAFSGLDPNKRYTFKGSAVRGGSASNYSNRWTRVEIAGADSFTSAHTSNAVTSAEAPGDLTPAQAAFQFGENNTAADGDMAVWQDIKPAANGTFSVICTRYAGLVPAPGSSTDNAPPYGYAITGVRLEAFATSSGPVAIVTSPTNNSIFAPPTNITITASVTGPAPVTNVAFYANNALVDQRTNVPYTGIWTNPPVGNYQLTVAATDNTGLSSTSAVVNVTIVSNDPPFVVLAAPVDGAAFIAPANIAITATATDLFGIAKVEFYQDGSKLGQDTSSPYTFAWGGVAAGNYQLSAVATDGLGLAATSSVVNITVTNNAFPIASIDSPTNNSSFTAPVNIVISASASDSDGTVTNVAFYAGLTFLGQVRNSPYNFTWTNASAGGSALYVVASDNVGQKGTSSVVNITVIGNVAPAVAITNPVSNASFASGSSIVINATATDNDGSVTNVAFYAGVSLLGQRTSSPYSFTWTNVVAGNYTLTAVAADNGGLRSTSAPVNISVIQLTSSQWVAFNDQGVVGNVNDTAFTIASLGTSSGALRNIVTGAALPVTLTVTNTPGPDVAGTMGVPAAGTPASTVFNGFIDWTAGSNPGFHVYPANIVGYVFSGLDPSKQYKFIGTAIRGSTTPTPGNEYSNRWTRAELIGALSYTPAHSANVITSNQFPAALSGSQAAWNVGINAGGDIIEWDNIVPPASGSVTIQNRQYLGAFPGGSGANALYSFAFTAMRLEEIAVSGPIVSITSPGNNALVVLPTNLVINAAVSGFNGTVTNVAFYNGSTKLADDPASPYSFAWSTVTPGTYLLRAVGSDNGGISATSAPVQITVQSNVAPSIAISSPANSAVFTESANIPIAVAAGDSDGAVTNVQFYANGSKIGQNIGSPFGFTWLNVPVGTYDLTAVATDDHGALATSSVVRVFVIISTAPTVSSFLPAPGTVSNLTQLTVNFTAPVVGVDASDLLINNVSATDVTGSNATYTFSFSRPQEGIVRMTWASGHGIMDRQVPPASFDGTRAGETAQYTFQDTIPPVITGISPVPGGTLTGFTHVDVTFSEPMTGVDNTDLLINGVPATKVTGSLAGPYGFDFAQPAAGTVQLSWAANHGIHDLAQSANAFVGGSWSYTLNPAVNEAAVIINEIFYHPPSENSRDEWVELFNKGTAPVDLSNWHLSGAGFTFSNVTIGAGAYLVVAADAPTFMSKHPGVTNVVGGWTGDIKKNLELQDLLGGVVNSVSYGSGGDWGERLRGSGEERAVSITRSGSTATATWNGYLNNGDTVVISGADQPEYNGTFSVSGATYSSFTYPVSGSPVTPATGTILIRQMTDWTQTGWAWSSRADGLGSSLELLNPDLPNQYGQNWRANNLNGTPGRVNSVASTNIAPMLLEVQHFPLVPRPANAITVTARVLDERPTGITATLWWRVDAISPPAFSSTPMFDDGAHGDGQVADGVFGAVLPAQANNTVIEFYVQARDAENNSRTWPAPALDQNRQPIQQANALLQVDNALANDYTNGFPVYRVIMRAAETNIFLPFPNGSSTQRSDARMNLTFISTEGTGAECIYLAEVRDRGAGTRSRQPPNWRVSFPDDHQFHGLNSIVLNTQYTHSQLAGYALATLSGLDTEWGRVAKVRVNNYDRASSGSPQYTVYIHLQPVDHSFATTHFPEDSDGNLYRAQAQGILGGTLHSCTLSYLGTNWTSYANQGYSKQSGNDDWSDLIGLCLVMNTNTADDAVYAQAVRQVVNVDEWMRYFAVFTLTLSRETSMATGVGDDYSMYRGVEDPRFKLIAHDWDTILNEGDTTGGSADSIFRMIPAVNSGANMTVLNRFMRHPQFVPVYYRELYRLATTLFTSGQLSSNLTALLSGFVPQTTINNMANFGATRAAYVLSQIPLSLTVTTSLSQVSGFYSTATPTVTLSGQGNVIDTRSILVNGNTALWSAWDGRWTNTVSLQPGVNRVVIQSLDSNNVAFASTNIDIWYNVAGQNVSGAISGAAVWSAAGGPYNVTGALTVGNGATLTIQPGASVLIGSGLTITVSGSGQVLAQGTPNQHIHIGRAPAGANWGSFDFIGATTESRLAYIDFDSGGGTTISSHNAQVHVNGGSKVFFDHLTFPSTPVIEYISFDASSFIVQNCVFPSYPPPTGPESLHGINGIAANGYGIFRDNYFGHTWGFNDTIDFTGGNRPGPILQIINNVFDGASDDCLDLDSTDAWIEGNIFMHVHRDPTRTDQAIDTGSAISGGVDTLGQNSDWTILNNLFYDVDHVFLNKGNSTTTGNAGGRVAFLYNTVIHVAKEYSGSTLAEIAAFDWSDDNVVAPDAAIGSGMYAAYNIIYDCSVLHRLYDPAHHTVIMDNNILSVPWSGPGSGNQVVNPMLNLASLGNTAPTNVTVAQLRVAAQLLPGSPAAGAGFGGLNLGGLQAHGMMIAGEPQGTTSATSATLQVGPGGTFNWGTTAVQPWGWTAYKWKLDNGPWSAEIVVTNTSPFTNLPSIQVSGLAEGLHTVYVSGRNDAGYYQDDAFVYPATSGMPGRISASHSWLVQTNLPLRLNELLARNDTAVPVGSKHPDLIELYNGSTTAVDLSGVSLTDDPTLPRKFVFPLGSSLAAGSYLVLYADNDSTPAGYHLGFSLSESGESVLLFSATGQLLDSVQFGLQIADYSIGRLADGHWALCVPTFGGVNVAARLGDVHGLRINEWLTDARIDYATDFLELYNPSALPVSLGGLYLSDVPIGDPDHHQIAALSFIAPNGYAVFQPDGHQDLGPEHLKFKLSPDRGEITLFDSSLNLIDDVLYGPQRTDISQGRSPNGSGNVVFFAIATPGSPNPAVLPPGGLQLVINEVLAKNINGLTNTDGSTPEWLELYNPTASPINLSDLSLSDDTALPRKYVFTNGPVLASGAYLVIFCDGGKPASANNSGFGIKANGGAVYLYDKLANGGSLLDGIDYGVQANDFSIGRLPDGGTNWVLNLPTPASHNLVATLGDPMQLSVNEWMANPASGDDWFELYNPNPQPVALAGLYLSDNLTSPANRLRFRIPALSFIGTGLYGYERFWADNGIVAGPTHCNFALKATGESVGISLGDGTLINGYTFGSQGLEVSEGRLPDGSANIVSFPTTATPGDANYLPITNVVISEVLSAWPSNSSLEGAIELQNTSGAAVDLSYWYLSNARRTLQKYQFTNGTILPAGGYLVVYQEQFGSNLDPARRLQLDPNNGDQIYLSTALTPGGALSGYRIDESFGPAEPGVSFGRYINSVGEPQFTAMSHRSFGVDDPDGVPSFRAGTGLPNPYPLVGPAVISEVMYHPPDLAGLDNIRDEFIEILNITSNSVPLYDPANPTNTWHVRNAVDFDFPPGLSLAAAERLVVVSFDPVSDTNSLAGFQAAYSLSPGVRLYGPYLGKLDNGSESIHLNKPGVPVPTGEEAAGLVPYILVDSVTYSDHAPWVAGTDGTGYSLQRTSGTGFGNDPTNWVAALATPGVTVFQDSDGDGIPDAWENSHGLDPHNAADAGLDPDGDGSSNLQEYLAGTDPHDPQSNMSLRIVSLGPVTIQFTAQAGHSYTLEYAHSLEGPWNRLIDISAPPSAQVIEVQDATTDGSTFYRIHTPQLP